MNLFAKSIKWLSERFWKKTKPQPLLKENNDFIFTEIILADEVVQAIKLMNGPFVNVVYYYGGVKIVPEHGTNRLAFQYTIWDTAGRTKADLTASKEFTTHLGDVLVSIISSEHGELEYPTEEKESETPSYD